MLAFIGILGWVTAVTSMGATALFFFSIYCFIGEYEAIILLALLPIVILLWCVLTKNLQKRIRR